MVQPDSHCGMFGGLLDLGINRSDSVFSAIRVIDEVNIMSVDLRQT